MRHITVFRMAMMGSNNLIRCFCYVVLMTPLMTMGVASKEEVAVSIDNISSNKKHKAPIPRACVPPHDVYPFCDPSLPLDVRLDDLISLLTLEEKPFLLTARESPKGNISRLGIPEYDWGANCMHGVQSRCAPDGRCPTSFPNPNALGATFNKTLWMATGDAIGLELRALWLQNVGEFHPSNLPHLGLDCWAPNVGISRDPRWGRNSETPSEDPYVCGTYGTMYTLGLQGNYSNRDSRFLQAAATLKHFVANSLEGKFWKTDGQWSTTEGSISRLNVNAKVSLYDLATSYFPSFRMAVQDGGAAGMMCSYNRVNGVPACADEHLLKKTLRHEWKFRGYVTSDSGSVELMHSKHHYTDNGNASVGLAISAGCDVESAASKHNKAWETGGLYIDHLKDAVESGVVEESAIDKALHNALGIRFRLGLFDPIDDQPYWNVPPEVVQSAEHVQLAEEATGQGFVLLKNVNQLVPLDLSSDVALIGPQIYDRSMMVGTYRGEICHPRHCVPSFWEGFSGVTSSQSGTLRAAQGCSVAGNDTADFVEAIEAASLSDVVVFLGGIDRSVEEESMDRPDIRLPAIQVHLLRRLSEVNPNIVLVLMHGGMVGLDEVLDYVSSVVSIGYPGRYAGTVLPETLYGIRDRAWGKSPITWYQNSVVDELNMVDMSMTRPPGRTYRYYTGRNEPHFRFGTGLNPLTDFQIEKVVAYPVQCLESDDDLHDLIETQDSFSCPSLTISLSVSVANVGKRHGDEVIMIFFVPLEIPASEPASKLVQQLFGFERVFIKAGKQLDVAFSVQADDLRLANDDGVPVTFPGRYRLLIGNGNDQWIEKTITICGMGLLRVVNEDELEGFR